VSLQFPLYDEHAVWGLDTDGTTLLGALLAYAHAVGAPTRRARLPGGRAYPAGAPTARRAARGSTCYKRGASGGPTPSARSPSGCRHRRGRPIW